MPYLIILALSAVFAVLAIVVFLPFFGVVDQRVAYTIALLGLAGTLGAPGAIGWYERSERLLHDVDSEEREKELLERVKTLEDEVRLKAESAPFALGALTVLVSMLQIPKPSYEEDLRIRARAAARRMGVEEQVVDDYWTDFQKSDRGGSRPQLYQGFRAKVELRVVDKRDLQLFDLGGRLANLSVAYGQIANRMTFLGVGAENAVDVRETVAGLPRLLSETKRAYGNVQSQISSRLQMATDSVIQRVDSMQSALAGGGFDSALVNRLKRSSEEAIQVLEALA